MTLRVLYVPLTGGVEEEAGWDWLAATAGIEAARADLEDAADRVAEAAPHVVWAHATTTPEGSPAGCDALLRTGAGLLLGGGAAVLPARVGLEPRAPGDVARKRWRDETDELHLFTSFSTFPHIRGHAAFLAHPLFSGLGSGTFTWWPAEDEEFTAVTYRRPDWPTAGRVIAVERSYIHVNADRATVWEYDAPRPAGSRDAAVDVADVAAAVAIEAASVDSAPTETAAAIAAATDEPAGVGRILCIGAYLPFASPDPIFRPLLERFAWNALHYAAGGASLAAVGTPPRRRGVWRIHPVGAAVDAALDVPAAPALDDALPPFDDALRLAGAAAADAPFTLAGRRALAAGGEARGVDEVWIHPLRVVQELRHEAARAVDVAVTPVGIERRLEVGGREVVERIFVPREQAAAIIEWRAPDGADLSLSWRTDLRLMWPYPAGALGPLRWKRDGRRLLVRAAEPEGAAVFALSTKPDAWHVEDASAGAASAVRSRLRLRLAPGEAARLAVVATTQGDAALADAVAALRPAALVRARAAAARRIQADRLAITAPDERAGAALEWAKYRLDSYLVETMGLGRSLVAGYWTSREGWNDGRPGYAWYFGRDAVWTALGSLACGDFDAARDVIRFLGEHQDLSGKVLHEATTSGAIHYDSADATPLYLLLVARYLAWTGDGGFVREQWERVRRAYAFCLSCDADGDGLIENTRVGHGWIEFGRLGGGTVTYYNAAIWTAALKELAVTAEAVGDAALAEELRERGARARTALEQTFWDDGERAYALNVRADAASDTQHAIANRTRTAMQAVPLLLGQADARRAASWLDAIASDDFSAPWGVRMLPASDPEYRPDSYHGGAVWPLYTGWVSWAEYAAGRSAAGFAHWWRNVEQCFLRQKGAWDEVLHGLEHRSAGVCPDQAWSTAMAVSPLVYGLLGAEPDAVKHRLRLRPQLPEAWDRLDVRRLRIGDAAIDIAYRREGERHTFRLDQQSGAVPITVILEPLLPARRLVAARVDGVPAELDARPHGERMLVPVQIVLDAERVVELDVAHDCAAQPAGLTVWQP